MDWVEYDETSVKVLPQWARQSGTTFDAAPYSVSIVPEGVVLRRGGRASALRWVDVLAPIRLDDAMAPRLLLAATRRPPHPPWFDLRGTHLAAIEDAIRFGVERIHESDYRSSRRARPALYPADILDPVLARDPLPGGVEICSPSTYTLRSNIVAGVTGTGFAGGMGLAMGAMAFPTDPLLLFGLGGAAALAGAGFMAFDRLRPRVGLRILVLTPDGFVGGLDGGAVRAFLWPRVASFTNGRDALGEPALEVRAVDGSLMSRTAARFFGEPLDVVVAVAEAYRRRAVASLSG